MTQEQNMPDHSAAKPIFEAAGTILGLGATACFLLSVLYDWGYFWALGVSFGLVPTTITDHVRSAIVWLPETFLIAVVAIAILPWPKIPLRGRVQVNTQDSPEKPWRQRFSRATLSAAAGVVLFGAWGLLGDRFLGGFASALIAFWGYAHAT